MKKIAIASIALLVVMAFAADAFAQRPLRPGCWGRAEARYHRLYNPNTVETINGRVVDIDYFTPDPSMKQGIRLRVEEPDGEEIWVHLGPRWYIENQDIMIREGDLVTVTGSEITFDGEPTIIASEVEVDNQILRLRDEDGYPLWAGWRRRAW